MNLVDLLEECSDIAKVLFPKLNKRTINNLIISNKYLKDIGSEYIFDRIKQQDEEWYSNYRMLEYIEKSIDLQFVNIKLYAAQWYILWRLNTLKPKTSYIKAPMSFGKTILGLSIASSCEGKYVICIPAKALQTWISEAKVLLGDKIINKDPSQSFIVVASNDYSKKHYDYFKTNSMLTNSTNKFAIITRLCLANIDKSTYKNYKFVVDEAATGRIDLFNKQEVCYLSANLRKDHVYEYDIEVKESYIEYNIPKVTPFYWEVKAYSQDDYYKYPVPASLSERIVNNGQAYADALYNIISDPNNGNKMVIFYPAGKDVYDILMPFIVRMMTGLKIQMLFFDKKLDVLDSFHKSTNRCVLLTTHGNSESVNIHADSVSIIRPDFLSFKRVEQLVGRVLRTSNPNRNIKVHYISSSGVGIFRSVYSEALRANKIDSEELKPPKSDYITLALTFLNYLKLDYKTIPTLDLLILLLPTNKEVYKMWKESKHELSEDIVLLLHKQQY